ncbi:MAG: HlyD family efflux transporter periplasmic adaptor subunit [Chloroflexota bacterium]
MRRFFIILGSIIGIVLVVGAGAILGGFVDIESFTQPAGENADIQPAADVQPASDNSPVRVVAGQIFVDARVVPAQNSYLSFASSGIVADILVEEGQVVQEGDVIAQLDAADTRVLVTRAEADLARVMARLQEQRNGALPEEIESAQANVASATARLERARNGANAGDRAAADAGVAAAQASLQNVLEGASDQELINARANLFNAEAELSRAQSAYDLVSWSAEIGALPQSAALQTATNNFEAARARLTDLENGPTQSAVAAANAEVQRAQAQRNSVNTVLPQDVAVAEADLRNAQAQLNLILRGTRTEQLAAAEADVAIATASYQQQLVALSRTELIAPFSGTIASIDISLGEQANAGNPVVRLADFSTLEIETEDLTELQVVDIQVGATADVTFDAIDDLTISGTVLRIRPYGQESLGDIVYRAVVELDEQDERLLWNMTAVVAFNQ